MVICLTLSLKDYCSNDCDHMHVFVQSLKYIAKSADCKLSWLNYHIAGIIDEAFNLTIWRNLCEFINIYVHH